MRSWLACALFLAASGWHGSALAHGFFIVNTTSDHDDGACEEAPAGDCSLREAIEAANAEMNDHPDAPDSIGFDFGPGAEPPFEIQLESPLPEIVEGLVLNGSSEPRFILAGDGVPVIAIDGGGLDYLFRVRADNTLFISLALTNAAVTAIDAEQADYLLVRGCHFGVDPQTGVSLPSSGLAFGAHAIHVRDTFRARIGGLDALSRNVLAGAGAEAILIEGSDSSIVHGNHVGVDASGLEARSNALLAPGAFAIDVRGSESVEVWDNVVAANVGGGVRLEGSPSSSVERNLIGLDASGVLELGNGGTGVRIETDASGVSLIENVVSANAGAGVACAAGTGGAWEMFRNVIGVDQAKSEVLPNEGDGVRIESGCEGAILGDGDPDDGNFIAHNEGAGVRSVDGTAMVRGNAIFFNQGLAIDAGLAGPTPNDSGDAMRPVNSPEGLELVLDMDQLTARACVPPGATVDVYEAAPGIDSGAVVWLGSVVEGSAEYGDDGAPCSATNTAAVEVTLRSVSDVAAVVLTATVDGHTSELSLPLTEDEPSPNDACERDADCDAATPTCDPVFRQCVAAPAEPPKPRDNEPASNGSGCAATRLGESATRSIDGWLILCIVACILRRRSRIFT